MAYFLVVIKFHDSTVHFPVRSFSGIYVANFLKAPEHFRNLSGEFANRKYRCLDEFWVRVEVAFIICVAE